MAEVVSSVVEKMQIMESVSYARGSKTAEAAMGSTKTDQHDVRWKHPEQVSVNRGRDSNYDPHYYTKEARNRRREQDRRERDSDYYNRNSSPRTPITNAQRRHDRRQQEDRE
jgi:hypothetical protein